MLCAAMMLPASEIMAFSLQDYEGGFRLGEWRGSLEGGYEYENQDSNSAGTSLSLTRNRTDELGSIANDGFYLIDPRLLTGSAGLNLDLYQEQDRVSHGSGAYSDGLLWGYSFDTSLFPQSPENATFFANQSQTVSNTTFGGQTQTKSSNIGVVAQMLEDSVLKDHGIYYFSSRLSAREETFDDQTTQLGQKYELDQQREIVDYTAEKGFQTADLRFRYEFENERDSGTSHLNFQTQTIGLDYSKDFGANLNRTWDSNISYYSRTGTGGQQQYLFVNELLGIQHYENLFTSYQYQLQYNDYDGQGATTYQYGSFILNHRWYDNLSQMLNLATTQQTLADGNTSSYWIGGSNSYSHPLPWHGNFFLNTNAQYQIQDNNLSSSDIQVIDEPHTAPLNDTPFTLNNTFVIQATIVVVDTQHGRIPCVLNVDYLVAQLGNQTQIKRAATSVVITPGDSLVVSYTYQVPASARFSTTTKDISLGVTFPWIDMSYAYDAIDQSLLSGEGAQFLEHMRSNTFSLGLHHDWTETLQMRANATYQTVDSSNISFNMTDLSQNASYRPGWSTLLSITGDQKLHQLHQSQPSNQELCLPIRRRPCSGKRRGRVVVCHAAQSGGQRIPDPKGDRHRTQD